MDTELTRPQLATILAVMLAPVYIPIFIFLPPYNRIVLSIGCAVLLLVIWLGRDKSVRVVWTPRRLIQKLLPALLIWLATGLVLPITVWLMRPDR